MTDERTGRRRTTAGYLIERNRARIADLLTAAAAEAANLVVLHYDYDFDLIAAVTGQPTEWIVPAGTVD